jgi:hypothetical protein
MAKASASKGGSSRIRFIMLEAELPEGDLSQVTQAIQNALKPATPAPRLLQVMRVSGEGDIADEVLEQIEADDVGEEEAVTQPKAPRNQAPRRYKSPDVVEIDLDKAVSFVDFATPKAPSSVADKYLTVAAWFKEERNTPAITQDHVYTCFRKIGWSTSIDDFNAPLRKLKHAKLVSGDTSGFIINHLGLDRVRKLGQG